MSDHDDIVTLGVKMDAMQRDVRELESKVDNLTTALNRYRGGVGGIVLLWSLLCAGVTLALNFLRIKT